MKTQINSLLSGTKDQILNPEIDYSIYPPATSHIGHAGSNNKEVSSVWEKVASENRDSMTIEVLGEIIELRASWSLSGKTVSYFAPISNQVLEEKFRIKATKEEKSYISIQSANIITVSNGKNGSRNVCPTLINIL